MSLPQPRNHRVLCQLVAPSDSKLALPDGSLNPEGKVIVKAIAPDVTACAVDDEILLIPNVAPIGYDKTRMLVFIHDTHILAVC